MDPSKAEPDQDQVLVWELLLRAHAAVVPRLAHEVEARTGLPLPWYDVLLELARSDAGKLRMQELGERVVLSRSRVSRIVDEMVVAGLVTKAPDPTDGRATLAVVTEPGRIALRRAAPVYLDGIARHFIEPLTVSELEAMRSGLAKVIEADALRPD